MNAAPRSAEAAGALVYFAPGCPFGFRLRALLALHRVPHTSVSIRRPEAAAHVRAATGQQVSPTVRVGDRWLSNPSWREVAAAQRTDH